MSGGFSASVIAGNTEAIETERELNPSQEVGHEKEAAVEHGDDGEILSFVIPSDRGGELIEALEDRLFMEERPLDVLLHPRLLIQPEALPRLFPEKSNASRSTIHAAGRVWVVLG